MVIFYKLRDIFHRCVSLLFLLVNRNKIWTYIREYASFYFTSHVICICALSHTILYIQYHLHSVDGFGFCFIFIKLNLNILIARILFLCVHIYQLYNSKYCSIVRLPLLAPLKPAAVSRLRAEACLLSWLSHHIPQKHFSRLLSPRGHPRPFWFS